MPAQYGPLVFAATPLSVPPARRLLLRFRPGLADPRALSLGRAGLASGIDSLAATLR